MDQMLDDVARILAGPMPRRRALKLASGVIFGGIFGVLGTRATAAACKKNETACAPSGKDACCPAGQTCCTTCSNKGPFCNAPANKKCPASTQVC